MQQWRQGREEGCRRYLSGLALRSFEALLTHVIVTMTTLEGRGIGFKSLTENIDITASGGKLIFRIFGTLAEFERDIIKERTQASLIAIRDRGKRGGRLKPSPLDNSALPRISMRSNTRTKGRD
jgi:DNA invertase Pin-like site-specific DNA recombinase